MKKILLLNYEFPPLGGGASPVSFEIAKRLSERGDFNIDVVTMGFKDLPRYEEINSCFKIHRVRCWRSKMEICHPWEQLTYLFSAYFKCLELVNKNSYDLCHAHFLVPTGILAQKLNKKFGLPYIITSHGSDVPEYNTDRFKFMHKFTGPVLRRVSCNAGVIIAPSNYLKRLITRNVSSDLDEKIFVIPNGFDSEKFTPSEKKNIILGTGRLLPRKGFQHLFNACMDRDIGYEIHICGNGPMMGELQRLSRQSRTKIVFHGWIDNTLEKYRELLESASIYVLPTLKENASIALLEAMSAGCAVITTDVSGCPETVGDAGLLVKPGSVEDLKLKLGSLIQDRDRIKILQKIARERIENIFEWDIVIDRYLEHF